MATNNNRYAGQLSTDVYGILADQAKLAHLQLSAAQAVAADTDGLLNDTALGTGATTVTTFLNAMPYPRNVTIVASATQTGKATVYGTNIADEVISEELTINSDTPVVGAKAFKTVTSIVLPVKAGSETVDVGWGDKIGLPFMLSARPLLWATVDGVIETTVPTMVVDADEVEKNTIDLNTGLNGQIIDLYLAL